MKEMYLMKVPSTNTMGSYQSKCYNEEDGLWDYNSAREHDGLLPVKVLPSGTKFIKLEKNKVPVDLTNAYKICNDVVIDRLLNDPHC